MSRPWVFRDVHTDRDDEGFQRGKTGSWRNVMKISMMIKMMIMMMRMIENVFTVHQYGKRHSVTVCCFPTVLDRMNNNA